jgi:hypothetical protein
VQRPKTEYGICDEGTYKFDKAGFMMGKILSLLVVTGLEGRDQPKIIQLGN